MWKKVEGIMNYRDLFYIFMWRDFQVRYRQAIFGAAWAIIQPLSLMLLFTFIFTYAMPVKVSTFPFPIFFYAGLLPWTLFSSSITYSIHSITGNNYLLRKIYFPRIILPLVGICTAFLDYLIACILLVGLIVFYKIQLSWVALWFFPLFLLLLLFIFSMSLILSVLNVYYRDVGLASSFLIQIIFFATPILYSIDKIAPHLKPLIFLNPLTFIVENMRRCLLEQRPVILWQYIIMFFGLLIFLALSYKFFKATERKFVDVL